MNLPHETNAVDRLLSQTRAHHVQLSVMADVKANIMLTLASLVLTFSFRYLSNPILRWPVAVNILFCVVTIVMAAYAVMPKISAKLKKAQTPQGNMLFFGNFLHMDFAEYEKVMAEILSDHNRVYEEQVKEIYEMGVFLGKSKYRFVRYAYISFISGLMTSGIVYFFALIFGG